MLLERPSWLAFYWYELLLGITDNVTVGNAIAALDYARNNGTADIAGLDEFTTTLADTYTHGASLNVAAVARLGLIASGIFDGAGTTINTPAVGWTLSGDGRASQLENVQLQLNYPYNTVRDLSLIGANTSIGVDVQSGTAGMINLFIQDKDIAVRYGEELFTPGSTLGSGIILGGLFRNNDVGLKFSPSAPSNFNVIGTAIQTNRVGIINSGNGGELRLTAPLVIANTEHGLELLGDTDNVSFDSYYLGTDFTENDQGNQTYTIVSIATHSAGARILVTLSEATNKLNLGLGKIGMTGTSVAGYNTLNSYIYAKPAADQVVLDRAFLGDATGGTLVADGYDIYIKAEDFIHSVRNHYFVGGNTNRFYAEGGYNINLIGMSGPTKSKWVDDTFQATIFQLKTLGTYYGAQATAQTTPSTQAVLDIPWSGPGSIGPIMEMGPFRMLGTGGYVPADGAVAVGMRIPYTAGGLGVDDTPNAYNSVLAYNDKTSITANASQFDFAAGRITCSSTSFILKANTTDAIRFTNTNIRPALPVFPETDGDVDCGSASFRWQDVRALNGIFSELVHIGSNTFVNLPASPIEGDICRINDCNTATWGATAAAGGANEVLVWYRGGAWRVFAA